MKVKNWAAYELNRNSFGFEIERDFYNKAKETMLNVEQLNKFEQLSIGI